MNPQTVVRGELVYGSYFISAVGTCRTNVRNRIWREFLRMYSQRRGWKLDELTNPQRSQARKAMRDYDIMYDEYEVGGPAIVR